MEKFSVFRDPTTGINPFLAQKCRRITPAVLLTALARLPIYLLFLLGLPVIPWLIRITKRGGAAPRGRVHANSASPFDRAVIAAAYRLPPGARLVFPEGVRTNNLGVLSHAGPVCDTVVGLKYSPECTGGLADEQGRAYTAWARLVWLVRFLGSPNCVAVTCLEGGDLARAAGLPALSISAKRGAEFLAYAARAD